MNNCLKNIFQLKNELSEEMKEKGKSVSTSQNEGFVETDISSRPKKLPLSQNCPNDF